MKANTNKAIEFLLARGNLPILYGLKKDILDVPVEREFKNLQKLASRIRILDSQRENGGWCRKEYENNPRWEKTYYFVETLHNAFRLYDYACTPELEEIQKMVDFLFSTQTNEGDFRGAYFNEYAPTYHALTLEVLCLFGLDRDKRVQKGFRWLLRHRQEDGGWVIPYRTIEKTELEKRYNLDAQKNIIPLKADPSNPSSHLVTGMVLRAMAGSPTWQKNKNARKAGELIISRFFKPDVYEDRQAARYWEEISYPFWATDILSSLDSLARIGFTIEHPGIKKAFDWLMKRQDSHGFWRAGSNKATLEDQLWVTLSVLRLIKQLGLLEL